MKKFFAMLVVFVMFAGLVPAYAVTPEPSTHTVVVDGTPADVSAVLIGNNNFFMLRDVADALRETPARFSVDWDGGRGAIILETGTPYNFTGERFQGLGEGATASPSTAIVYVDGTRVNLRAYNIADRNFFMLRDLGDALGFDVDWYGPAQRVLISTATAEPVPEAPIIGPQPRPEPTPAPEPEPEPTPEPEATPTPAPAATPTPAPAATPAPGDDISASDFVRSLGQGWNLGNQFDAHYARGLGFPWIAGGVYANTTVRQMETAWLAGARSVVTREFLQLVYDTGFTAIRIPVTWYKAATNPEHTIREDWMERIYEVVGWAYDIGFHIILNTHHENNHYTHADLHAIGLTDAEIEYSIHILTRWWEQIAEEFEGFSNRLMFAGLNEPRGRQSEWTGGTPETRANLNRLNQAFVNTVRASGGNNASRFLIVPTHAASATPRAFDGFEMPTDTANDRLILAVHTYSPFRWAHDGQGTYEGPADVRRDLERVATNAERMGVPVILSEWGSINNNRDGNLAQREQHARDYVTIARELGMATFWWDNDVTQADNHAFGLFNRARVTVEVPTIIDAIMEAHGQ